MKISRKILAVITARGGSKGVPNKNIRLIDGKPLISYTIEVALASQDLLHRIIVSTDDTDIAEVARNSGVEVPFMRPSELSTDKIPTLPVLQHAIHFVENQESTEYDWVLLLQPTSPLRAISDVYASIDIIENIQCDSVISVERIFAHHPKLMKKIKDDRLVPYLGDPTLHWEGRRQDLRPEAYLRNGAIYLTRRDVIVRENSLYGNHIHPYVMPPERSVSIDSELDLLAAQQIIQYRLEKN